MTVCISKYSFETLRNVNVKVRRWRHAPHIGYLWHAYWVMGQWALILPQPPEQGGSGPMQNFVLANSLP